MGSLLKTSIALFLLFILAICFIGYFLPKKDTIDVTKTINCPSNHTYKMINELKNWEKWSPWMEKDPAMKLSYSDSSAGVGAFYTWAGNKEVEYGKLSIVSNKENQQINTILNYAGHGDSPGSFTIDGTKEGKSIITWSMTAGYPNNWFVKNIFGGYMYLMMNHFLTKDFSKGLENLEKTCTK